MLKVSDYFYCYYSFFFFLVFEKIIKDNDYLVEHTTRDKIWGDGGDKGTDEKGSNLLGKLLTSLHHVMKYENCDNMPEEIKNKIKDINL